MGKESFQFIRNQKDAQQTRRSDLREDQQQSQFELPNQQQRQKYKKVKEQNKRLKGRRFKEFSWSIEENKLYMQFLRENISLFECDKKQKQSLKINVKMSKFIKTRTSDQCRSHHQKMMKYHQDINGIIKFIDKLQLPDAVSAKPPLNPQIKASQDNSNQPSIVQDDQSFENLFNNYDVSEFFDLHPQKITWYDDSDLSYY